MFTVTGRICPHGLLKTDIMTCLRTNQYSFEYSLRRNEDNLDMPLRPGHSTMSRWNTYTLSVFSLDVKTGLLTGLLTGTQDWKCPVALSQTCYESKSLKVILMDSNFGGHPVLNPLVTMWSSPTFSRTFFQGKKFIFWKEGTGLDGHHKRGKEECP